MNTHRGIGNRLLWMQEQYRLHRRPTRVLQKTPFSFDVSVWEFFWPLLAGARLVLARPERPPATAPTWPRLIQRERRHRLPLRALDAAGVPGRSRAWSSAAPRLRDVICSGEALPLELQERFFARLPAPAAQPVRPDRGGGRRDLLGSAAGATRASWCRSAGRSPTRRCTCSTGTGRPVPVGVPGELYIGGVQAGARLPRPARADRRAVRARPVPASRGRLYRTGDLGALAGRRRARVPRPARPPGQGARLPHRAGRDRGGAAAAPGGRARRSSWPARTPRRHAAGRLRRADRTRRRRGRRAARATCRRQLPEYMVPAAVRAAGRAAADPQRQARPQGAARAGLPRPRRTARTWRRGRRPRRRWRRSGRRCWASSGSASTTTSSTSAATRCSPRRSLAAPQTFAVELPCAGSSRSPRSPPGPGHRGEPGRIETSDRQGRPDEDQILSRLDQLSDEEVDALLSGALAEEEVS